MGKGKGAGLLGSVHLQIESVALSCLFQAQVMALKNCMLHIGIAKSLAYKYPSPVSYVYADAGLRKDNVVSSRITK